MTNLLERFDSRTAAGILARAAIWLDSEGNPAAEGRVQNEAQIRDALINNARLELGISLEDNSPEKIEQLADYLDQRSADLSGKPDFPRTYDRLLEEGTLPSDMFRVRIDESVGKHLGELWPEEEKLIKKTISSPWREQHFGNHVIPGQPALVSLFARRFYTPFPFKNFIMLVAGQRMKDLTLSVPQAWRIYPSLVNLSKCADLVDYLRRFAERYGFEITLGTQRGKFFLSSDIIPPQHLAIDQKGKRETVSVLHFYQRSPITNRQTAALTIATNLDAYLRDLKSMQAPILE